MVLNRANCVEDLEILCRVICLVPEDNNGVKAALRIMRDKMFEELKMGQQDAVVGAQESYN